MPNWRKIFAAAIEIGASMLPGAVEKGANKGAEILTREKPEPDPPRPPLVSLPDEPAVCVVPGGECLATPHCTGKCKYR